MLAVRAQQPDMPVVGFINAASAKDSTRQPTAFRHGLSEIRFVEGQNVTTEYHCLEDRYHLFPALAADLVRRRVAVIALPGSDAASALAPKLRQPDVLVRS